MLTFSKLEDRLANKREMMAGYFKVKWLLMLCIGWVELAHANYQVLLLNSYHPQYQWTAELVQGVRQTLEPYISPENLHIEFMDARRFVDDERYHQKLIALLQHKYQQYQPDVVISSDDAAFDFLLKYGQQLFPETPVVFSGVNVFKPEQLSGKSLFTGIAEGMDIEGNLELIRKLQPDIQRIILLGDVTGLGLRMVNHALEVKKSWQQQAVWAEIDIEIWDNFTLDELYQWAASLPKNSALLMLAVHKDREGRYFSFSEHLPKLAKASPVPIYGMWGALMIGNGVIGGMMNDPAEHGAEAAAMALSLLQGKLVKDVPVKLSATYRPQFDYRQLRKFSISEQSLPTNSQIYYQPQGIYQQYRSLINAVLLLISFLIVVIFLLSSNIRRQRQFQQKLDGFNRELEQTVSIRTRQLKQKNKALEKASQKLKIMAYSDSLTGLRNRRGAYQDIPAFIQRYQISQQPLALVMVDIDHFKAINDQHGHQFGDEVLCHFSAKLTQSLRPSDIVYRWGGEEFLIVLPDTPLILAQDICQRLVLDISQMTLPPLAKITASMGLTVMISEDDLGEMILRADNALYQAKATGRDRVVCG